MSFLLPIGLAALMTLPVILALHLLNEQRRRTRVPSLLLWQNVPRRFEGERSRRLPITALLLLHLLAAALIGLALGRPQIPGPTTGEARHTAILLDTSTSMAAEDGGATRFQQALDRAREIVRGMAPGDRATVVAMGPQARIVASGGAGDAAALDAALGQLQPGGTGTNLDAALTLAEAALDPQLSRRVLVITDGAMQDQAPRAVAAPLEWVQVGDERPNRAITAFSTRSWGGRIHVYARVANFGRQSYVGNIRLVADDETVSIDPLSIAAGGETELTWTAPGGSTWLRVEMAGDDALPQDDSAVVGVARARPLSALVVSGSPAQLQRVLGALPGVAVTTVAPADYAGATDARSAADLTIFDGFLPPEWPAGATLAISPPPGNPLLEVTSDVRLSDRELRLSGTTLGDLSLSGVNLGSGRAVTPPAWAETLLTADEIPLIMRGRSDGREIAIWTFDLASGNLPSRLAFPLLMARTVRDLAPPALPTSIAAGDAVQLRPDPRANEVQLTLVAPATPGERADESGVITLPAGAAVTIDRLTQPGLYRVEELRGEQTALVGLVGVNAGSTAESNLTPRPAPQLSAPDQALGAATQSLMTDIWPWLALAAAAVLAIEWLYVLLRGRGRGRAALPQGQGR